MHMLTCMCNGVANICIGKIWPGNKRDAYRSRHIFHVCHIVKHGNGEYYYMPYNDLQRTYRQVLVLICFDLIILFYNCRLLNPDLDSSGSLFVGSYILQLILHLSSHMALHIRDLVVALVRRMETSEIVGLKNSILLIFARLVCDFFQGNSFHFSNIHNCFGSSFFYIAIVLFLLFSFAGAFERSKCWEIYQFTSNYTSKRL